MQFAGTRNLFWPAEAEKILQPNVRWPVRAAECVSSHDRDRRTTDGPTADWIKRADAGPDWYIPRSLLNRGPGYTVIPVESRSRWQSPYANETTAKRYKPRYTADRLIVRLKIKTILFIIYEWFKHLVFNRVEVLRGPGLNMFLFCHPFFYFSLIYSQFGNQ